MTTTQSMPEIAAADLQAALEFLTTGKMTPLPKPSHRSPRNPKAVAVHHGIVRARNRSADRPTPA